MTTHSSAADEFRKTAACPASEILLRYHRHRLSISDRAAIQIHLHKCDFCNAELQLLMKHRGVTAAPASGTMPAQLREFAEKLLMRDRVAFALFKDLSGRHQLSH